MSNVKSLQDVWLLFYGRILLKILCILCKWEKVRKKTAGKRAVSAFVCRIEKGDTRDYSPGCGSGSGFCEGEVSVGVVSAAEVSDEVVEVSEETEVSEEELSPPGF